MKKPKFTMKLKLGWENALILAMGKREAGKRIKELTKMISVGEAVVS